MGIMAGVSVLAGIRGVSFSPPGPETAIGSLIHYITDRTIANFQPMNTNFGIMPVPNVPKAGRAEARSERALLSFEKWMREVTRVLSTI